ncbi:ribonuclease E inhibitor RraB [Serratia ureilytica]
MERRFDGDVLRRDQRSRPERRAIDAQVEQLVALAERCGVNYDGWGTYFEDRTVKTVRMTKTATTSTKTTTVNATNSLSNQCVGRLSPSRYPRRLSSCSVVGCTLAPVTYLSKPWG